MCTLKQRPCGKLKAAITEKLEAMMRDYSHDELVAFAYQIGADQCNVCGGPTIVGDHTHPRFRDQQMGVS